MDRISSKGTRVSIFGRAVAIAVATLTAAIVLPSDSARADVPPAAAALIPAAKAEGQINLSWSPTVLGGSDGIRRFEAGFNKYYGMQARFNYNPAGLPFQAAINKMWQEKNAGQKAYMDVAIGGDTNIFFFLKNDLLIPVNWAPLLPHIRADLLKSMASADGSFIAFQSRMSAITYNTRAVAAAGAPKSFQDLLDPKWKGKIGTTPYAAGFQVLATDPRWGIEKTFQYARAFSANVSGFMSCSEYDRITSGEFWIFAPACEPELAVILREKGAPIAAIVPQDAQQIVYRWIGVPKHAENPNMATLFVAFLLTPDGQRALYESGRSDLHSLPGSRTAPGFAAAARESGKTFDDQDLQTILKRNLPQNIDPEVAKIFRERR
jgi:ABC-type Fe3+ transport system substrate-binding protein